MKKPLLIDLDGVLRIKGKPAPDLKYFLDFITEAQIPSCILSNSTLSTSKQIVEFFKENSIHLSIPIITAIDAAKVYITEKFSKVAVYVSENVISEFSDFLNYETPQAVLIGDIGNKWNYQLMQTIFQYVNNGAELIAAHKNRFWEKSDSGILLDAGPFIHAIEYAASVSSTLIGKPSKIYFQSALKKIGADINEPFFMIGDDIDSDISGSKKLGATTILIYSGKTKKLPGNEYSDIIDFEAENLIDVEKILRKDI